MAHTRTCEAGVTLTATANMAKDLWKLNQKMVAVWILYITFGLMAMSGANHFTGYIAICSKNYDLTKRLFKSQCLVAIYPVIT